MRAARSVPVLLVATLCGAWPSLDAGCADSQSLAPSTATEQSTQGQQSEGIRPVGALNLTNCGAGGCEFDGEVQFDGPGCISNVRGVTHLLDASGKELASQPWTINGRMRPGQRMPFKGCCFSTDAVKAHTSDRTDVTYNTIQCI